MQLRVGSFLPLAFVLGAGLAAARAGPTPRVRETAIAPLPQRLADTGLFLPGSSTVRAEHLLFSPKYPLWSDGATKRRWLSLPHGTFIDAARPDAWEFPRGTRLWKEFAFAGRKVETRFIERLPDGSWRFAAYVWNEAGSEAVLAPAAGFAALPVEQAPGGRYAIPAEADCRSCHEGAAVPVLGAGALQLSPDRDPLAPHAETPETAGIDLRDLIARGWLRYLPAQLLSHPPRIVTASAVERAALGYLHANCGHCHNNGGSPAPVGLELAHETALGAASTERTLASMLGAKSRFRSSTRPDATQLVMPGNADVSVLALRMRSRNPYAQMPPLGTHFTDAEGFALIERWINHDLQPRKETAP